MKTEYELGKIVWIAVGKDKLSKGTIVHKFELDNWPNTMHYVIQIETSIEPLLEVRCWDTISEKAKGPLNFWKRLKDKL